MFCEQPTHVASFCSVYFSTAEYLVVYAHPNPKSFNNGLLHAITEGLKEANKTFVVRDLYGMKWDPTLAPADFEAMGQGQRRFH